MKIGTGTSNVRDFSEEVNKYEGRLEEEWKHPAGILTLRGLLPTLRHWRAFSVWKLGFILACVSLATLAAEGQIQLGLQNPETHIRSTLATDTISMRPKPFFVLPLALGISPRYKPDFFRRTPMTGETFFVISHDIDIASPWKLELAEQNEYRALGLILGSIGAGGAAWVAYQHIKKYGIY